MIVVLRNFFKKNSVHVVFVLLHTWFTIIKVG